MIRPSKARGNIRGEEGCIRGEEGTIKEREGNIEDEEGEIKGRQHGARHAAPQISIAHLLRALPQDNS